MKAIAISFTLKNQPQDKIFAKLEVIQKANPDALLIHGFLPKKILLEKGFPPTDVIDKLEELFPVQLNMYNEKPLRKEMAQVAVKLNARVYVIGNIIEGVEEDVNSYEKEGVQFTHVPLDIE